MNLNNIQLSLFKILIIFKRETLHRLNTFYRFIDKLHRKQDLSIMEAAQEITLRDFMNTIREYAKYIQQLKKATIDRMNCIMYILRYTILHRNLWENDEEQKPFVHEFARHYKSYLYGNKIANFEPNHIETFYMLCDQILDPEYVIG